MVKYAYDLLGAVVLEEKKKGKTNAVKSKVGLFLNVTAGSVFISNM